MVSQPNRAAGGVRYLEADTEAVLRMCARRMKLTATPRHCGIEGSGATRMGRRKCADELVSTEVRIR